MERITEDFQFYQFILTIAGILITFLFRVLLDWKHRIATEYTSKRDVAISMLQGKFVEKTSNHFDEIFKEKEAANSSLNEIYKKPGKLNDIQSLSYYGEKISKVKRLFRQIDTLCMWSIYLNFLGIFILIFHCMNSFFQVINFNISDYLKIIYSLMLFLFFTIMFILIERSGKFLKLTNNIIEPET